MYWKTSKPVRFGTMRQQSDQVPIIVNDALEDEALSWDNSPIEGKISNYKQSWSIFSKFDFIYDNIHNLQFTS